jgi:polar amino acid transport system substrate-binding protein
MSLDRKAKSYSGLALSCAALLFATTASAEKLHLLTEAYPPFNYEEKGVLKGVAVDLLKAVMADARIDYDMRLQPWARAYGLALNMRDYCVFSTVRNAERETSFEWVGPLFTTHAYLVKKAGSPVNPTTVEDAKHYLVGTQLGDYTVDVLKSLHFSRIDLTSEIDLSLKKLLAGRIDLMPMAGQMLSELRSKGVALEPAVLLLETTDSLACNRQTDPAMVERMRKSLDKLIADGTRERIFKDYGFSEGAMKP